MMSGPSVYQSAPSGPAAMPHAGCVDPPPKPGLDNWKLAMSPEGLIRTILLSFRSGNQTLPSGAAVISPRSAQQLGGTTNIVIAPVGVTRPTRPVKYSLNQIFPSAPAAIPRGNDGIPPDGGTRNS